MAIALTIVEMGNACEYQRRQDLKGARPRHGRNDHGQHQREHADPPAPALGCRSETPAKERSRLQWVLSGAKGWTAAMLRSPDRRVAGPLTVLSFDLLNGSNYAGVAYMDASGPRKG